LGVIKTWEETAGQILNTTKHIRKIGKNVLILMQCIIPHL